MTHSADHTIDRALDLIEQEGGLIPFIRNAGFGGIAYAIIARVIMTIDSFGRVFFGVPIAIGEGFILMIEAFFLAMESTLGAGTATTVRSFSDGLGALLGPLAQPGAIGVIMLSLGVFIYGLDRLDIAPIEIFIDAFQGGRT